MESEISDLSVAVGAGGGYSITQSLRLRLDLVGAFSVASRRIIDGEELLTDLGAFTLDTILGFELSF